MLSAIFGVQMIGIVSVLMCVHLGANHRRSVRPS
jgi:hypothetical protein